MTGRFWGWRRRKCRAAGLAVGVGFAVLLPALVVVVMVDAIALAHCGNGTPTANVTAPAQAVQTMGQDTKYLESEGLSTDAAAGIVGNLMQESTLNPTEPGYGLAQWNPGWWESASAWITAHGQNPDTAAGQLMYIAANVQQGVDGAMFYPGLTANLRPRRVRAGGRARVDERLRTVLGSGPCRVAQLQARVTVRGGEAPKLRRPGTPSCRRRTRRQRHACAGAGAGWRVV